MDLLLNLQHSVQALDVPQHHCQGNGVAPHAAEAEDLPQEGANAGHRLGSPARARAEQADYLTSGLPIEHEKGDTGEDTQQHATVDGRPPQVQQHLSQLLANLALWRTPVHGGAARCGGRGAGCGLMVGHNLLEPPEHQTHRPQHDLLRRAFPLLRRWLPELLLQVSLCGQAELELHAAAALQGAGSAGAATAASRGPTAVDVAHQAAEEQTDLQVAVPRLRSGQASCLAREQPDHALVPLALQHLLEEARLAREGDELPEVLDGRLPEAVEVVRHAGGKALIELLCLRILVMLNPSKDCLHASHVVVHLLLQIRRKEADQLLGLFGRAPQNGPALPLKFSKTTLLLQPQAVIRLIKVGPRDERVLRHDKEHEAPQELVEACVLANAFVGPRVPCEARELQDVRQPAEAEAHGDHRADHQHGLGGAVYLDEVV
mmetsp:Transcript_106702/g.283830  ORF Transcript_106702/g.283830 Transcript_106702/m.283830 type:complete len:433 (-) Transcript_106702:110-1408(-)